MVAKSNEEYLYQTVHDCFPEAALLKDGAQNESNHRLGIIKFLLGKKGVPIKEDYQLVEWRLAREFLIDTYTQQLNESLSLSSASALDLRGKNFL